jgi:hypothetical protein
MSEARSAVKEAAMDHAIACRRHPHHSGARHGIVFAISLVTAGALFLLEHLGYLGGYAAWRFWPLFLVYLGLSNQIGPVGVGSRIWGLLLVTGGGLGLAHTLGLAAVRWDLIWPVGLVVIGAVVMLGVVATKRRSRAERRAPATGSASGVAVMASRQDRWDDQAFEGGEIKAVMGELELDLSGARMQQARALLLVKVVMGEIRLRVPREWQIEVTGSPLLGEVKDRTRPAAARDDEVPPRLVLECDVVMGSVEVSD